MANFKMSPGWEKELEKAVRPALKDIASDYQKMFDSLLRRYKGRPVYEIKPVLRREWSRVGGSISDPELTEYATHISEGTRIQMRVK
ncbi:hypothetical protein AA983_07855 [Dermacoccus sp. PE3]|uniref:hypothetical protein n=1 Tax=Dermacoccus sp. PE3 TaxID=1641401 RepID=UPI000641FFFE|nr:hypothetical protein [Dermacoccus sp. PE3]KLO63223.1 hypothetical protein AA983_07855 [Dermacoccus sp. PE3]